MSIEGKIVKLAMLNRFYQELPNFFVKKETGKGLSTNDYTNDEKADVAKIADIETALDNKIDGEIIEDGGGFVRGFRVVNDSNYSAALQLPPEGDGKIHFTIQSESTNDFILAQESDITIQSVKVNGTALTPNSNKAVNISVPGFSIGEDLQGNPGAYSTSLDGKMFTAIYTTDGMTISLTDGTKTTTDTLLNATAVNALIATELADISGVDFVVVAANEELPATGANGKFYLKATGATGGNKYDEYVWVNHGTAESPDYGYEKLGTMDVDLTGYIKESDLQFATTEDILAIFNSGGN